MISPMQYSQNKTSWVSECGHGPGCLPLPGEAYCSRELHWPVILYNNPQHLSRHWECHGAGSSPERCSVACPKWSPGRVGVFSEAGTLLWVKALGTTSVKLLHLLRAPTPNEWRCRVLKILSPPLFWTPVLINPALWAHRLCISVVLQWEDSGMSEQELVLSNLKDKCSKPHLALILDYYLQRHRFTQKGVFW